MCNTDIRPVGPLLICSLKVFFGCSTSLLESETSETPKHTLRNRNADLALANAEEETSTAKEPQASEETDERKSGRGPQESLEEMHGSAGGA
jgi:hypothetical protein